MPVVFVLPPIILMQGRRLIMNKMLFVLSGDVERGADVDHDPGVRPLHHQSSHLPLRLHLRQRSVRNWNPINGFIHFKQIT